MKRLALLVAIPIVLFVCASATAARAQEQRAAASTGTTPAPVTEVERLKRDLAETQDALGQARAERAACETTLGPVEMQFRRQSIERDRAELKADMEKARPGFECNPRTLECVKKPEPQKAPAKQ